MPASRRAKADVQSALKLLVPLNSEWRPKVLRVSAKDGYGLNEVYDMLWTYKKVMLVSFFYLCDIEFEKYWNILLVIFFKLGKRSATREKKNAKKDSFME